MALYILLNNYSVLCNKLANFLLISSFSYFYYERYLIKYSYYHTMKIAKNELVNNLKIISEEEYNRLEILSKNQMEKDLNNQINKIFYENLEKKMFKIYIF